MYKKLIILLFSGFSFLFSIIIYVPYDYPTIQEGINNANMSDTIFVIPNDYNECISIEGKSLEIIGDETSNFIPKIICNQQDLSVITIQNNINNSLFISGFILSGANNSNGLTITDSNIELKNIKIEDIKEIGLYGTFSNIQIDNLLINNPGENAEIIIKIFNSNLILDSGIIENLVSSELNSSVIVALNSEMIINDFTFQNNYTFDDGTMKIYNSDFFGNKLYFNNNQLDFGQGGAINIFQSEIEIFNSIFENNSAPSGGAISSLSSHLYIENCNFENNSSNMGGAINHSGDILIINHCKLSENIAESGGAISAIFSDVYFEKSICDNNTAQLAGGCIEVNEGSLFIGFSNIINNNSFSNGLNILGYNSDVFILSSILMKEDELYNNFYLSENSRLFISHTLLEISDIFLFYEDNIVFSEYNIDLSNIENSIFNNEDSYIPHAESILINNGNFNLQIYDTIYYQIETFEYWSNLPDIGAIEYIPQEELGDVNSDEIIDILDVILLVKIIQSDLIIPQIQYDLLQDGEINILDILLLVGRIIEI